MNVYLDDWGYSVQTYEQNGEFHTLRSGGVLEAEIIDVRTDLGTGKKLNLRVDSRISRFMAVEHIPRHANWDGISEVQVKLSLGAAKKLYGDWKVADEMPQVERNINICDING